MELNLVQGEFGYWIEFTLFRDDRTLHTLVGTESVEMRVRLEGSAAPPLLLGSGSVHNAVAGIIRVFISQADATLLRQGRYTAQVSLSRVGQRLLSRPFTINLTGSLV